VGGLTIAHGCNNGMSIRPVEVPPRCNTRGATRVSGGRRTASRQVIAQPVAARDCHLAAEHREQAGARLAGDEQRIANAPAPATAERRQAGKRRVCATTNRLALQALLT
jgi:hypothetical protein